MIMGALAVMWKFLKGVPLWVYAVIALTIAVWLYGRHEHAAGKAEVHAEWAQSVERGKAEVARLTAAAGRITVRTETVYRDRIQVIHEKARQIEVVREVFVPTNSGMLAGGFRLYHDAAATNTVPDAASIPNAAPVAVADVATTVASNYEQCYVAYARVTAWESWAAEQCKLNDKGCPIDGQ